jgi:putative ABC transport system permease protein
VRFNDLVRLALSALWQHRLRTVLTTLGVVFGSFVLGGSLSARYGVEDTITREYTRHVDLRRIEVHQGRRGGPDKALEDKVRVPGKMSAERRERLRRRKRERLRRQQPQGGVVALTPERVQEIADLDHVLSAHPLVFQRGRVFLNGKAEDSATVGVQPDSESLRERLLAGSVLPAADGSDVLVSEYLLYELGVVDEADVPRVLGRPLRLEYRPADHPRAGFLLTMLHGGDSAVKPGDEAVLEKVLRRLPDAAALLDLPKPEKEALARLLRRPAKAKPAAVVSETLTVRGVLRAPTQEETMRHGDWVYSEADVFLPERTAERLFARLPGNRERGYDTVVVLVDRTENVKKVDERIRAMGFFVRSAREMIQRQQFAPLLATRVLVVVGCIALLVAALGIINTMLMSVLERTREIGILKAVGARNRDIQSAFLMEGTLIGLAGGLLGLLLSWAFSFPADAWLRGQVQQRMSVRLDEPILTFPWWLVLGTPLFAVVVTTLAALYPARRAVRVDPVTSLRYE